MMDQKDFVLVCAGEDSGDALGEVVVQEICAQGYAIKGTGGPRMQKAGLVPLADYEELPVSGFGDVLPRYFRLRKTFKILKNALLDTHCVAFIAIDYPGFNMKLMRLAFAKWKNFPKVPALYIAPPQAWAWKSSRAKKLQKAQLAVLFAFEKNFYESKGCRVQQIQHPFAIFAKQASQIMLKKMEPEPQLLLFPGSRLAQLLRNLPFFLDVARLWHNQNTHKFVKIVVPRESLKPEVENFVDDYCNGTVPNWLSILVAPADGKARFDLLYGASLALSSPGTATLELALAGVPLVVSTVPDKLTYFMGSHFVKTQNFALPSIILEKKLFPEFICSVQKTAKNETVECVVDALQSASQQPTQETVLCLQKRLLVGKTLQELALEFLGKFVQGNAH